jgi:hypothetical protein
VAIRENRPIFHKPRQRRAGLGPWMLVVLLALLGAAGLYVYDKRHADQIAALRTQVAELRATVEGAAAARKAMQGVASKQSAITGGQVTAMWRAIKKLQERAKAFEADLKAQAAKHAETGASVDARAAAMLKDIAALRRDMAALLSRLAAVEKRLPQKGPAADPGASPEVAPKTVDETDSDAPAKSEP